MVAASSQTTWSTVPPRPRRSTVTVRIQSGKCLGRALLPEPLAVDPVGEPLEVERPARQVREHDLGHVAVVGEQVALDQAGVGEERLGRRWTPGRSARRPAATRPSRGEAWDQPTPREGQRRRSLSGQHPPEHRRDQGGLAGPPVACRAVGAAGERHHVGPTPCPCRRQPAIGRMLPPSPGSGSRPELRNLAYVGALLRMRPAHGTPGKRGELGIDRIRAVWQSPERRHGGPFVCHRAVER